MALPSVEFKEKFVEYHQSDHSGINETYEHFKSLYYIYKLKEEIIEYINRCETCLESKHERQPSYFHRHFFLEGN